MTLTEGRRPGHLAAPRALPAHLPAQSLRLDTPPGHRTPAAEFMACKTIRRQERMPAIYPTAAVSWMSRKPCHLAGYLCRCTVQLCSDAVMQWCAERSQQTRCGPETEGRRSIFRVAPDADCPAGAEPNRLGRRPVDGQRRLQGGREGRSEDYSGQVMVADCGPRRTAAGEAPNRSCHSGRSSRRAEMNPDGERESLTATLASSLAWEGVMDD